MSSDFHWKSSKATPVLPVRSVPPRPRPCGPSESLCLLGWSSKSDLSSEEIWVLRNLSSGKNPRPLPGPPLARCPAKLCIRIPHTGSTPGPHLCVCGPPWWVAPVCWVGARNGSLPGLLSVVHLQNSSRTSSISRHTGLSCFLALPPPPPQFLWFSVLGPAHPSLAADLVSSLVLGLQLGTAAVLGAPGASAAPAAPGVARAPRAAPPPRDGSPAAVTMTTAVR